MVADEPDFIFMDEGCWQERAEEAELIAKAMSTPEAKVEMHKIAYAYARLARRACRFRQTHDDLASRSKPPQKKVGRPT